MVVRAEQLVEQPLGPRYHLPSSIELEPYYFHYFQNIDVKEAPKILNR